MTGDIHVDALVAGLIAALGVLATAFVRLYRVHGRTRRNCRSSHVGRGHAMDMGRDRARQMYGDSAADGDADGGGPPPEAEVGRSSTFADLCEDAGGGGGGGKGQADCAGGEGR